MSYEQVVRTTEIVFFCNVLQITINFKVTVQDGIQNIEASFENQYQSYFRLKKGDEAEIGTSSSKSSNINSLNK